MEITLTLDEALLARLEAAAARRRQTVAEWLTEQLATWIGQDNAPEDAVEAWARHTVAAGGHAGGGYVFRRADCYEDRTEY